MASPEQRAARWLGIVADLLQRPLTHFPHAAVSEELAATFDVVAVPWAWGDAVGNGGFELFPSAVSLTEEFLGAWHSGDFVTRHPVERWLTATRDPAPQTIARVPSAIASRHDFQATTDVLRPMGCDQELALTYRLNGPEFRTFYLARTHRDYSDDDLEVARLLQPIFCALDRQVQILGATLTQPRQHAAMNAVGLTGRELAVLSLLADGYTAVSIARRLSNSPRTVHKHLGNIYRKLEVRDRLTAVMVAQERNLFAADPTCPGKGTAHGVRPLRVVETRSLLPVQDRGNQLVRRA
jgi:DNA-binding CsgD family transcriptional regulator